MPDAPTLLGTVQNVGSGATSIAYPSISPSNNSLIIGVLQGRSFGPTSVSLGGTLSTVPNGQGASVSYWNSEGGTPWDGTKVNGYGSNTIGCQVFTAVMSSSAGSGQITWNFTTSNRMKMWVYEVTSGFDPAMPIRQWNFDGSGSSLSTLTDNLPLTPLSTSRLFAFGMGARVGGGTVSEDTGWTEVNANEDNNHPANCQHRTGTTSAQYGIGFGTAQDLGIAIGAIEIRADSSIAEQPTVEQPLEYALTGASTFTLPKSGSISPPNDAWILVPVMISEVSGNARSVSSISSTFNVTGDGWQQIAASTAVGNDAVRVEWWYAQTTSSAGSGALTITFDASYSGFHGGIIFSLPGTATDDPSAGTSGAATSASLSGATSLTGTLGATPGTDSIILCAGVGAGNSNQNGVIPADGFEYVGPPDNEGGIHTTNSSWAGGDVGTTFGGQLGASGFDHADGAAFVAIEIPAPSSGASLAADSGSYSLSGAVAALSRGYHMAAAAGSLGISGAGASLLAGRAVAAESGSYTKSGSAAELDSGRRLAADSGSFAQTGADAAVPISRAVVADSAAYLISGTDTTLSQGVRLVGETGAYTLSGTDADLDGAVRVEANSGTYELTGSAAGLARGLRVLLDSAAYLITGSDADLDATIAVLDAESGAYVLSGTAAGIEFGAYMLAEMGVIQQSANDVNFVLGLGLVADGGTYTITGTVADLLRGVVMAGESGQYLHNGAEAALTFAGLTDFTMPADGGALSLTGTDIELLVASLLGANAGTYGLTGAVADLSQSIGLPAEGGAYSINGTDLDLLRGLIMAGEAGTFALQGTNIAFSYSGDVVIGRIPNIVSSTTRRSITH